MENALKGVKGQYSIHRVGKYLVFLGKKLLISDFYGTLITERKDLRNVHKLVNVGDNQILVDCGTQRAYIMLSLTNGEECWRVAQPKMDISFRKFALSPDRRFVYDIYDLRGQWWFVCIDLLKRSVETFPLQEGLRCVMDLTCDTGGIPCLLESHYEMICDRHISQNGIRYIGKDEFDPGSSYYWKSKWEFVFPRRAKLFVDGADLVLTDDLYVFDPKTGRGFLLTENEINWKAPGTGPIACWVEEGYRLVLLYDTANVVFDLTTRKVIAQYASVPLSGCLVCNDFWVSTDAGVYRKSFPVIEDIPIKPCAFWGTTLSR